MRVLDLMRRVHLILLLSSAFSACGTPSDDGSESLPADSGEMSDAKLYCWGWNHFGQLGNRTASNDATNWIPTAVD